MNYDVIIHKCKDPVSAATIAQRIAGWAGKTPESVYTIITSKTACVRKGADEKVAQALKREYEKLGAEVELRMVSSPSAVAVAARGDDEEEEMAGRLLSDEEYVAKVNTREDIFVFEGTKQLFSIESVALVLAVFAGLFLSTREFLPIATNTDFFEPGERVVIVNPGVEVERPPKPQQEQPVPREASVSPKRVLKPAPQQNSHGNAGGGGDYRSRVTRKGVLGILAGSVKGKTVANADMFGKGGWATDIDAILSGIGGLKNGGAGGAGRRVASGIGFGPGYNSGFNGGSGGVGELLDNLMSSTTSGSLNLIKRGKLEVVLPKIVQGGSLTSGRSRSSIMQVVLQNLSALRHAYNKRLQEKPGLNGRITVKFAIDEFGKVLFCSMEESTMGDEGLESQIVNRIKNWKFDRIDKPGDVTEVVYPFVFSQ